MNKKVSDTQLAIELIPELIKENKTDFFSFEEVFNMLIQKRPDIFLDDIGDARYGILRGIVSRYQNGTLFLKNIIISKNKHGILMFRYSDNSLLKNKNTYKLYINTINYYNVIQNNSLSFDDFIELSNSNQEFIKLIIEFNKSIKSFLSSHNLEEG